MKDKPTIIHINQLVIRQNNNSGARNPPVIIRKGKSRTYCHSAKLLHGDVEVGRIVYRPDSPLDCGARVWLELDELIAVPEQNSEKKNVEEVV